MKKPIKKLVQLYETNKYLAWSLSGHLFVFLFMVINIYFEPDRPDFARSVRVDLVALPDKLPKQGPKPKEVKKESKPKKEKKVEKKKAKKEKKKKKPSAKVAKKKQKSALDRLKALNKIKKKQEEAEEPPEEVVYKGNVKSEGTSLVGVEKLQHDRYLEQLQDHINQHWVLPAFLENTDKFSATVKIRLNMNGAVIGRILVKVSGNTVFDQSVLDAISKASPLPPPPKSLARYMQIQGIGLRFPK